MMFHRTTAVRWAMALLLSFTLPVRAATISISPLRLELGARHRTDIITLRNAGEAPLRVQVRVMLWTVADDGQWQLTPSKDLIVTPELIEIAPAKEAQLRVGTLLDVGAGEGTYRLLLDELPNLDSAAGSLAEVRVLTQVSMPVFVEPEQRTRLPSLSAATVEHGTLAVSLGDSGTQRLDPQNINVSVLDKGGHVLEQRNVMANYVLPGRTWFLSMKLPMDACVRAATVSVTWPDLAGISLTHAISTDARTCSGANPP